MRNILNRETTAGRLHRGRCTNRVDSQWRMVPRVMWMGDRRDVDDAGHPVEGGIVEERKQTDPAWPAKRPGSQPCSRHFPASPQPAARRRRCARLRRQRRTHTHKQTERSPFIARIVVAQAERRGRRLAVHGAHRDETVRALRLGRVAVVRHDDVQVAGAVLCRSRTPASSTSCSRRLASQSYGLVTATSTRPPSTRPRRPAVEVVRCPRVIA